MKERSATMAAREDKQAIRRIIRDVATCSGWWVVLLWGIISLWPGLRSDLSRNPFFPVVVVYVYTVTMGSIISAPPLRALPIRKRDLGKAAWLLAAGYPLVLMAGVCAVGAFYRVYSGVGWAAAWDKATLYFSYVLLIDGVLVARTALLMPVWEKEPEPDQAWSQKVDAVTIIALVPGVAWLLIAIVDSLAHTTVMAVNFTVGGAGLAIAYRLRERLLLSGQALERSTAARQEADRGTIWTTTGVVPWSMALLIQMSEPLVASACIAVITVIMTVIITVIFGSMASVGLYSLSPVYTLLGPIIAGAGVNVCGAWISCNRGLRALRMLPLSRAQLGGALVGMTVAGCMLPWTALLAAIGMLTVAKGDFTSDQLLFLLSLSILVQGALLTVLPIFLKGVGGGFRTVMFIAGTLSCMGLALFSAPLLARFKEALPADPATHGWAWLAAGTVILCAGMAVSAWHASRVLRHGDCYRKAEE